MVPFSRRILSLAALAALSGLGASAQSVISAHSGVIHVSEGAVFVDNQAVNQKYGTFPDLKEKSVLRTEQGRAEILLTPGVFLRVGENSAIKMIDNRLSDTRVELVKGSAVVECDDPMKENAVTIAYQDFQVHVRKTSVMEFVSNPAELKVLHGETEVELNGVVSLVKAGKMLPFTQALAQEKFDVKTDADELTRWSEERSEAVSVANVSAAKSLRDSGGSLFGTGYYGSGMMPYGSWYYNPYYSMYTYLPYNGMFFNPYGFGFFSPYSVYQVYANPGYYGSGYGYGGAPAGISTASGNRPRPVSSTLGSIRAGQAAAFGSSRTGSTNGLSGLSNTGTNNGFAGLSGMGSAMGGGSVGSAGAAGHAGGARGK